MITYYDAFSIEIPIRRDEAKRLMDALLPLSQKYNGLLSRVAGSIRGGKEISKQTVERLNEWLDSNPNSAFTLEVFNPASKIKHLIVVEVSPLKTLRTDFGKQHRRKCIAYLKTCFFLERYGKGAEISNFHDDLRSALKRSFRLKALPKILPVGRVNSEFESFSKRQKRQRSSPRVSLKIVNILKDQNLRNIILRTRQAKDPTAENIAKSTGLELKRVKQLLTRACSSGVLSKQFNLVCKKCSSVLARVQTKDSIGRMVKENVACPSCKKSVERSSAELVFIVNPRYEQLLDGSKWMHFYVKQALQPFGIRRVLSEVVDGPNELDLVANLEGSLVLMELKDNRFSIGHAYSFIGKCSQYKPEIALVIATQGIDQDVKSFIEKTKTRVNYVESIDDIGNQFQRIFSEAFASRLRTHLRDLPWPLLIMQSLLKRFGHTIPKSEMEYLSYGEPF